MNRPALLTAVALVAAVAAANWVTTYLGLIPAGFGLMVTAGTYAAGLSLALRDELHKHGLPWVFGAIAGGIVVSLATGDGRIALASAAAFALAETADLAVYAPLRRRQWHTAVAASNAVGAVVDTFVFIGVAALLQVDGIALSGELVAGQLLVKAVWVTATYLLAKEVFRRAVPRERLIGSGA